MATQPKPKADPDRADEAPAPKMPANRISGARFLGGAWLAPDGTPLTAPEAQQAHRAMDAAAAEARAKALRGEL